MLESVNLDHKLDKDTYSARTAELRERLRLLQYRCKEANIPTIIALEGWDTAGKGVMISQLLKRLDPRGFKVHPTHLPSAEEESRPYFYRYWVNLPPKGEIALFVGSWYQRVLKERVYKTVPRSVWFNAFTEILQFERQMYDYGATLIKFFLHISKKEQRRRLEKLSKDKYERWRVTKEDLMQNKLYDKHLIAIEEMLASTNSSHAPWTIVEATDLRFAEVKLLQTIVDAMEDALRVRQSTAGGGGSGS